MDELNQTGEERETVKKKKKRGRRSRESLQAWEKKEKKNKIQRSSSIVKVREGDIYHFIFLL